MLTVRVLCMADLDSADQIIRVAYGTEWRQQEIMRRNLLLQPDGWFLALKDEEPVGLVGATNYGAFAHVGLMSVLPDRQRQGVGRILMEHVLEWIRQQGCAAALLDASEAGFVLYSSLGFVVDDYVGQWQREREEKGVPVEHSVQSLSVSDLETLVTFDTVYFGGDRSRLLQMLLEEQVGRVFATRNSAGELTGYLCVREHTLGPWIAESEQDAEVLLAHALATVSFTDMPMVLAPHANISVGPLLERYRFREQKALRHMRLGPLRVERRRANIYGQVSFALG